MNKSLLSVDNVSKRYGQQIALHPTSLDFAHGETTVLIGPSGCGKSTLLRLIVGLIHPDTGRVIIEDMDVTPQNVEKRRHEIGYVIQDGGLFPHLTALQNVTLLARHLGRSDDVMRSRVQELADLVQLPIKTLVRFPADLSGGQRQRVSLMRALMLDPKVLLLDEPLGALDPITRGQLQTQLREIFRSLQKTVILVTHDMGEAAFFASDIILLRDGTIVQRGTLTDLWHQPASPFVTEFIQAQRSPLSELTEVTAP